MEDGQIEYENILICSVILLPKFDVQIKLKSNEAPLPSLIENWKLNGLKY